jgi:hypothetical protein
MPGGDLQRLLAENSEMISGWVSFDKSWLADGDLHRVPPPGDPQKEMTQGQSVQTWLTAAFAGDPEARTIVADYYAHKYPESPYRDSLRVIFGGHYTILKNVRWDSKDPYRENVHTAALDEARGEMVQFMLNDWKEWQQEVQKKYYEKYGPINERQLEETSARIKKALEEGQGADQAQTPGGIDLDPRTLSLRVMGGASDDQAAIHFAPADIERLSQADGFTPRILSIRPMDDIRSFMRLSAGAGQR